MSALVQTIDLGSLRSLRVSKAGADGGVAVVRIEHRVGKNPNGWPLALRDAKARELAHTILRLLGDEPAP